MSKIIYLGGSWKKRVKAIFSMAVAGITIVVFYLFLIGLLLLPLAVVLYLGKQIFF